MKLRQFASGCVYLDDTNETYDVVHTEKIEALKDLRESYDGGMLVVYGFKSEYEELKKAFPTARRLDTPQDIADWNARKIDMALVHPASVGHGLNLQFGGSVAVWYSLTYDAELYARESTQNFTAQRARRRNLLHFNVMILDWIVFIILLLFVIVGVIVFIGFLFKLAYAILEWIIDL